MTPTEQLAAANAEHSKHIARTAEISRRYQESTDDICASLERCAQELEARQ